MMLCEGGGCVSHASPFGARSRSLTSPAGQSLALQNKAAESRKQESKEGQEAECRKPKKIRIEDSTRRCPENSTRHHAEPG
jgi:hypothetical protein